jgi:hypothetical protein
MGQRASDTTVAPTIWEIPDDVRPMIQTMLNEHYPAKPKGHRPMALGRVLNGIIFRLRTAAANGINSRRALGTVAPCLATSSSGANVAS